MQLPEEIVDSRDGARLLLGLVALAVAAANAFAVFHWSLPIWWALPGLILFIVCSNSPDWIIPRTMSEQDQADSEVLRADAEASREGILLYSARFAIVVFAGMLGSMLIGIVVILFEGKPASRLLLVYGVAAAVMAIFLVPLGLFDFWSKRRKAKGVQKRFDAETAARVANRKLYEEKRR